MASLAQGLAVTAHLRDDIVMYHIHYNKHEEKFIRVTRFSELSALRDALRSEVPQFRVRFPWKAWGKCRIAWCLESRLRGIEHFLQACAADTCVITSTAWTSFFLMSPSLNIPSHSEPNTLLSARSTAQKERLCLEGQVKSWPNGACHKDLDTPKDLSVETALTTRPLRERHGFIQANALLMRREVIRDCIRSIDSGRIRIEELNHIARMSFNPVMRREMFALGLASSVTKILQEGGALPLKEAAACVVESLSQLGDTHPVFACVVPALITMFVDEEISLNGKKVVISALKNLRSYVSFNAGESALVRDLVRILDEK